MGMLWAWGVVTGIVPGALSLEVVLLPFSSLIMVYM